MPSGSTAANIVVANTATTNTQFPFNVVLVDKGTTTPFVVNSASSSFTVNLPTANVVYSPDPPGNSITLPAGATLYTTVSGSLNSQAWSFQIALNGNSKVGNTTSGNNADSAALAPTVAGTYAYTGGASYTNLGFKFTIAPTANSLIVAPSSSQGGSPGGGNPGGGPPATTTIAQQVITPAPTQQINASLPTLKQISIAIGNALSYMLNTQIRPFAATPNPFPGSSIFGSLWQLSFDPFELMATLSLLTIGTGAVLKAELKVRKPLIYTGTGTLIVTAILAAGALLPLAH